MKRILRGITAALLLAAPAMAEEHKIDFEQEMEHLEFEHARAEFEFEKEMRIADLQERQLELDIMRRQLDRDRKAPKKEKEGGLVLILLTVNILMAVWVYGDVRRKNKGNGLWIVITLLVGFFGAAVYALIRIGDSKSEE